MSGDAKSYAELEIGLSRGADATCQVELRYSDPESETEITPVRGWASFDREDLLQHQLDAKAYGNALTAGLFSETQVRDHFRQVKTAVEAGGRFLRLRLRLHASASDLQALRWELLRHPEIGGGALATSEKMLFSRFMASRDWRPVKLRPRSELKALVAVSSPSDLGEGKKYPLADVDLEGEIGRACAALEGIRLEVAGRDEPLTLDRLVEPLRDGDGGRGVDVLYLACHGAFRRRKEPVLYLQNADGTSAVTLGAELAERLRELTNPPRLVFLASCDSALPPQSPPGDDAGTEAGADALGEATAQASLAPRLAEAGVSAIVAMQGKISMQTLEQAVPAFFSELMKDGRIDRALAVARGRVRLRHDAWMPALYTRLKSGRLWYVPGFAGEGNELKRWQAICNSVRKKTFVPILGADVAEHLYGTTRDLAERLARAHGFPLARHQRTDLAKVAQFLTVRQSRTFARDQVKDHLRAMLLERHPDLKAGPGLRNAVVRRCLASKDDPFCILTDAERFPASVYVTAASDLTLAAALRAAGRKPTPLYSKWRKTDDNHPEPPEYEGAPTPEAPIVFHAFGVRGKLDSLVLTEDDYLEYLISTGKYDLLPPKVAGTLVEGSLIFLGFSLDELAFRVLFRMIMSLDGRGGLDHHAHVGVQVDPEEHSLADVERARDYLKDYLGAGGETPAIDVYWGTAADFLSELRDRLEQTAAGEPVPETGPEDDDEWAHLD